MKIKELISRVLFYVTVPKCVMCKEKLDYTDRALCNKCLDVYRSHKKRNCPKCSRVLSECSCSYDSLETKGIKTLIKIFRYSKSENALPSNYLVYSLKQDNRKDVLSFLADELSAAIKISLKDDYSRCVITNVPRRDKAIVNFGYDHAKDLAKAVSKRLGIDYLEILKSDADRPQKSLHGDERKQNAKFDYKCNDNISLKGKTVILIDDIITTGASMINCALLIRKLKPRRIIGATLGTAYKEKNIDYIHSAP